MDLCHFNTTQYSPSISKIHKNPMTWEACGPKACRWNAPRLILFLASLRERVAMAQFRKQSTWFRARCSSKMESASVVCWASKLLWCYLGCVYNLNTCTLNCYIFFRPWSMHLKLEILQFGCIGCFGFFGFHKSAQRWDPIRAARTAAPSGIGGTRIPASRNRSTFRSADRSQITFHGRRPDLFRMLDEALEHI